TQTNEVARDMLNDEQRQLMTRIVLNSGRYFVSGPAGTGKSTLLRALCEVVREHGVYEPIRLAPSGVAAANISGQTIHS
ncbi:hypothetical protein BCR41DRAFT_292800, partial [Lobosporangium transversale]